MTSGAGRAARATLASLNGSASGAIGSTAGFVSSSSSFTSLAFSARSLAQLRPKAPDVLLWVLYLAASVQARVAAASARAAVQTSIPWWCSRLGSGGPERPPCLPEFHLASSFSVVSGLHRPMSPPIIRARCW